ncbi:MAG TPA: TonB-dependent receptor [Terriglobales bacterium]|jgi:outer membrane receptor protein involved in Fe transport|nr:TonB-dependent receptor [Terriglobales bacterium]
MKNSSARSFLVVISLAALFFFGAAAPTAAQQATAQLTGTVKDPSGAIVVGAKVTLKNSGTNIARTVDTNKEGDYLFTLIPIGTYELTVEQQGFSKAVQRGIKLEINQNARLDITLQLGTETQTVEVSSAVTQVDTISATLGKVETTQRILDLPLVNRDTLQLGLLQAGVFAPDPDDGSLNPFSVSGQRSESLTFLLDGADNNDFLGNNIVVSPNPDAVAEFKILTNNYNAEYGRTSGGIVNQVIKSGTNAFHGTAFEFLRNDVLNARDYFLPERTSFKRNVFGGTIGGPIIKDKTFFFVSYQGTRRREGQVAPILTVPSLAQRTGDFREDFTGDIDPVTGLDTGQLYNPIDGTPYPNNQVPVNPVIANYIDKYMPKPNLPNNQFISGPVARIRSDQAIVRVDHNISSRDTLSGVYLFNDAPDFYPFQIIHGASTGGDVPVGSGFSDKNRFQTGSLTWTHTLSPNMLNEFRFAANRAAYFQAIPQDTTSPQELGFTNVNPDDPAGTAPPLMFVDPLGLNLGPSPQGPTKLHDVTFQFQDTLSLNHGNHNLKFGADLRWVRNNFAFDFFNNGSYFFGDFGNFTGSTLEDNISPGDVLADFVGGFYDNYFQFSTARYGIRTHSLYFFAQDSWKVLPRLTVDLGIRYEYNSPQIDPHDNIIGFFPGRQSSVFSEAPPDLLYPGDPGTPNRALVEPDRNNFAPRLGFSWDILGNAKLVMRGGYGIFYDLEDGALNLQFGGQPPFGAVSNTFPFFEGISGDPVADPYTPFGLVNPFPFASAGKVGTFADPKMPFAFVVSPHFRTPYAQNFNFGFQYQVTKDTMVEAVYVGSLSRKAVASNEVNFPLLSILQQQLAANGVDGLNPECARPLAACDDPLDPSSFPHGAQTLITNQSNANSSSHEFQLTVDKQVSHGLALRAAYTMAKTIDVSSGFRARSSTYTDPTNPAFDRGLADFDATHRLVISANWDIPWDKPFKGGNAFLRKLTEGWSVNPIITFQSGNPFTLFQNNNSSELDNFLDRPDQLGPIKVFGDPRPIRTISGGSCGGGIGHFYFDPTNLDCVDVPLFSHGNMGRNVLRGPGINNWDMSFLKKTKLTETTSLEFRGEMFNAFNHAQFLNPDLQGFSPTFGQITTARPPRLVQFALKFIF